VRLNKEKFDRLKWGVCQKVSVTLARPPQTHIYCPSE